VTTKIDCASANARFGCNMLIHCIGLIELCCLLEFAASVSSTWTREVTAIIHSFIHFNSGCKAHKQQTISDAHRHNERFMDVLLLYQFASWTFCPLVGKSK